jgi:predicted Rossmann fold flavoprotein
MAPRIAIVGGGAAGIFAALSARANGADAVILERNKRIGIKILISGGGKCNITHDASPSEIEEGFVPREARFLRYALHELSAREVIGMLDAEGVATTVRANGRVFPESGRAEDVLSAFERLLGRAAVEIRCGAHVQGLDADEGAVCGVVIDGALESFDAVIVATGGMSYRKVGTTGEGFEWARRLGHTIVPVRAALAPIYFATPPPPEWQGVALRDVVLRVESDRESIPFIRKEGHVAQWRGDLLLTHRGVSGPTVLEVSRLAALLEETGKPATLVVDLLPDEDEASVLERWEERLAASSRSEVQTFVEHIVPHALVQSVLASAQVQPGTKLSNVSRADRGRLLATLKSWRLERIGEIPIDRGEVTAGGVALGEVSPVTMESKLVKGLYFAGEALDVSGSVGGYNLQAAFSTGFVAGRSAARSLAADRRTTQDGIIAQ